MKRLFNRHGKWLLLVCAAVFLTVGIYQKELVRIYQKAIRICLECIGIG